MWVDIVRSQMRELERIASWASGVKLDKVRDLCREAKAELRIEYQRCMSEESEERLRE